MKDKCESEGEVGDSKENKTKEAAEAETKERVRDVEERRGEKGAKLIFFFVKIACLLRFRYSYCRCAVRSSVTHYLFLIFLPPVSSSFLQSCWWVRPLPWAMALTWAEASGWVWALTWA